MKIIYVHGFNSGGSRNEKAIMLAERFGGVSAPDLPPSPDEAIAVLVGLICEHATAALSGEETEELILVGTSLGGFYAQYLSKVFSLKCVLINPSLDPFRTLATKVGRLKNFTTGVEYDFTPEHVSQLTKYYVDPNEDPMVATLVALDMGDELLDSAATARRFEGSAKVVTFEGGTHRFTHMAEILPEIEKLEHVVYQ